MEKLRYFVSFILVILLYYTEEGFLDRCMGQEHTCEK